jgi:hypothetical protein
MTDGARARGAGVRADEPSRRLKRHPGAGHVLVAEHRRILVGAQEAIIGGGEEQN